MNLLKTFLEEIALQIFPGNAPPKIQYQTFIYRFERENYSLKNTEIGKMLSETLGGDCESGVNQFIKEVIKKLYRVYQDELAHDGIFEEHLGLFKSKQGRKANVQCSPWRAAYKWLWEDKYPRWQEDYIWTSWRKRSPNNSQWIQFSEPTPRYNFTRSMVLPEPQAKESIPLNTPLQLEINFDLETERSYFLLFNRGSNAEGQVTSKYLVAPSQAFFPSYLLMERTISMPQVNAMCDDIRFDAVGKEEYLAIVFDEALSLPWLTPDPTNPALEWQGRHLEEIWEHLHDNKNWRVFYRDFDVVASNM